MLLAHPAILECSVVAVADEQWGERPKAFISLKQGAVVTETDVIQFARDHPNISRFMVPREVEIVRDLPKTSTGKVRKNVLRRWTQNGRGESRSE